MSETHDIAKGRKAKSYQEGAVIVTQRTKPTCGRSDCEPDENPEHWIDLEVDPEVLAGVARALQAIRYYHEHEGAPETLRDFKTALARLRRTR